MFRSINFDTTSMLVVGLGSGLLLGIQWHSWVSSSPITRYELITANVVLLLGLSMVNPPFSRKAPRDPGSSDSLETGSQR
ncbi:hypothetical protein ACMFWY_06855 [Roseiconus sp. JC912]|uniref:hypothetical protein n=1 Tax=Roseiconus sp. JC912 TaxID=3396307 RepID=UPI003A4C7293